MNDPMLPAPPDMIVFLPRHTLTFTGNHACVDCHVTGSVIYDADLPDGFSQNDFLELFTEED